MLAWVGLSGWSMWFADWDPFDSLQDCEESKDKGARVTGGTVRGEWWDIEWLVDIARGEAQCFAEVRIWIHFDFVWMVGSYKSYWQLLLQQIYSW